jgi:hypothetical protein
MLFGCLMFLFVVDDTFLIGDTLSNIPIVYMQSRPFKSTSILNFGDTLRKRAGKRAASGLETSRRLCSAMHSKAKNLDKARRMMTLAWKISSFSFFNVYRAYFIYNIYQCSWASSLYSE